MPQARTYIVFIKRGLGRKRAPSRLLLSQPYVTAGLVAVFGSKPNATTSTVLALQKCPLVRPPCPPPRVLSRRWNIKTRAYLRHFPETRPDPTGRPIRVCVFWEALPGLSSVGESVRPRVELQRKIKRQGKNAVSDSPCPLEQSVLA